MSKSDVEYVRALIINNNCTFDELIHISGMPKKAVLNHILTIIDNELYTKSNPFYKKKVEFDQSGILKIDKFLKNARKLVCDTNYFIKNKSLVIKLIDIVHNEFSLDEKIKPQEFNFELFHKFVEEHVFEIKDLMLFKKITDCYLNEFKLYFNDVENINYLLEKFIDEIKKSDNEVHILGIIKMLAYIFSSTNINSKTKGEISHAIENYFSKFKSPKINYNYSELLIEYFQLLRESIIKYEPKTPLEREFIAQKNGVTKDFHIDIEKDKHDGRNTFYRDLTMKKTITIDKSTLGCLEDAISIIERPNGNTVLYVYIIDPFSYIKENSAVELEARKRTKNIYSKGEIITMFPEVLTYGDLSLIRGEKRKVVAHEFEFSKSFDLIKCSSYMALINVDENYTFDYFDKGIDPFIEKEAILLDKLTNALRNTYSSVSKYYNAKNTYQDLSGLKHKGVNLNSKAGEVINYLKVFLNNNLASNYQKTDLPFIYLVNNDAFDLSKIVDFTTNVESLKALKSAIEISYSTENTGHTGLGVDSYARVTTPARNYAALRNQELYKKAILLKYKYSNQELYNLEEELKSISKYMNEKERLISSYIEDSNINAKLIRKAK